jgi:flagellar biosynthesis protein FlhG
MARSAEPEAGESRLFSISSGKGGVGKTSVAVNLGVALARAGRRVLIVDGDLGLANVDILLGLSVRSTVADVLDAGVDPASALIEVNENLSVLPATSGLSEMASLGPEDRQRLEQAIRSLARRFDLVVIDTDSGIGPVVQWFNSIVDHNIVVLTPEPTSITDAYALIKVLHLDLRRHPLYLIVNCVDSDREGRRVFDGLCQVTERFLEMRPQLLGIVPRDDAILRALREKTPAVEKYPESPVAHALVRLAESLIALEATPARA